MLDKVQWSDQYLIGIDIIDEQHRQLIETVNQLIVVPEGVDESVYVEEATLEMLSYAMYHLRTEEAILQKHNFPDYTEHKAEHSKFVHHMNEMIHNQKDMLQRVKLLEYLVPWITQHIFVDDMVYRSYLVEQDLL